jgi:4'-phosphopantetheinyl transferase
MLNLNPEEIHLWFVFADDIHDDSLLERYRSILSDEERSKEKHFYFLKDRRRYLITRAMVRTVLSRYKEIEPNQWKFSKNAYGRPEIAGNHETGNISFNISHTQSLIVLGVSNESALGIDIENFHIRKAPLELASHYFHPSEATTIYKSSAEVQDQRFFQFWTLKESYVKTRGRGLSIPFEQFRFHLMNREDESFSEGFVLSMELLAVSNTRGQFVSSMCGTDRACKAGVHHEENSFIRTRRTDELHVIVRIGSYRRYP